MFMVKERGRIKMNKNAIIRTQLLQQLKYMGIFLMCYILFLGTAFSIENYTELDKSFDGTSYFLVIYLIIVAWISFSTNITLYSYHSYSRQTILNRTVIVQLIISFLSGLFVELHNLLVMYIPFISFIEPDDSVRVVYTNPLITNNGLRFILSILFMTLVIFCVLLLADLILVLTYSVKRKKLVILLVSLLIVIFGVLISMPYWTNDVLGMMIKVLGFLTGTGQAIVPSIVIPTILVTILGFFAYIISLRKIKKIEVHKKIFI